MSNTTPTTTRIENTYRTLMLFGAAWCITFAVVLWLRGLQLVPVLLVLNAGVFVFASKRGIQNE